MLVLTRKLGESITCTLPDGSVIVLTLVEVRGDKARIGIDAPKSVQVLRTELIGERRHRPATGGI